MIASLQSVTATFRQNLRGQLVWLECCPNWACATVYAERIHHLIVAAHRAGDTPHLQMLIDGLNGDNAGNCGLVIAQWLERTEEKVDA
jgi:hypothetical protein